MKRLSTFLLLLTSACIASGTQVNESQLLQFQKGESTYPDVISKLGAPNSSTLTSDGGRMACYTYVRSTARPESFIPLVGAFVGGADAHMNSTCLTFDADGLLKSYSSTSSQTGAGYGLESGSGTGGRVSQEPRASD